MSVFLKILLHIILVLFLLKIAVNVATPYVLLGRLYKTKKEQTDGVSLMPAVEIALLVALLLVGAFVDDDGFFYEAGSAAVFGVACVVLSYVHLVVVGLLGGRMLSKRDSSNQ